MARTEIPAVAPHRDLKWIGKSLKRVEDPKFLRGLGKYVDDVAFPGMLHAAVLRSPFPHARIASIDAEAARNHRGVVAVMTGAEAAAFINPLPDGGPTPDKHVFRVLAVDKVRYVGEGVAIVVADSRYLAEDARDLIDVEYEPLEPIVDPLAAAENTSNLVHEALGTNIAYERTFVFGEVERHFAEADVVVRDRLHWRRAAAMPLENASAIGVYDAGTGEMTIHANSISMSWMIFALAGTLKVASSASGVRGDALGGCGGGVAPMNSAAST